jgi:hypothetical protein
VVGGVSFAFGILALLLRRRRANDLKAQYSTKGDKSGFDGSDSLRLPLLSGTQAASRAALVGTDASDDGTKSALRVAPVGDGSTAVGGALARGGNNDAPAAKAGSAAWVAPADAVQFTAKELLRVTSKYALPLGAGSFGTVYSGTLSDGRQVAVKQMELASKQKQKAKKKLAGRTDPYAGLKGFRLELEVLSKYRHPHLVELIGYCVDNRRLKTAVCSLVLEFMPGGALLDRLRPTHVAPPLTAQQRFDIAADVARALHYLHTEAPTPLIHQDVKTDNILLAEIGGRLVAKVADFGTARMAPQLATSTHHSTGLIVGTRPYMPYEYLQSGHVSEKTDTFAFGVVLLELLTGKPPFSEETSEPLHAAAYDLLCDPASRLAPLLDGRTASWGGGRRALELCLVAKRCLEHERARCTMREAMPVVVALL